jgi:RNA polymerase sigma factor (sigma-70 family)
MRERVEAVGRGCRTARRASSWNLGVVWNGAAQVDGNLVAGRDGAGRKLPGRPPEDVLAAHRESVWGFVLRQVGERSLAEDLTQETLLRAGRSIGAWRGEAALRSWIFSIAVNVVRDHVRGLQRALESTSLIVAAEQASPEVGPEQSLLESEMAACIGGYVSRLPRLQHRGAVR